MPKEMMIYIHIPFCVKKCIYCDFLSGNYSEDIRTAYVNALIDEIVSFDSSNYIIVSIFIGGGTPSILTVEAISKIMFTIQSHFAICENAEITIEANPRTVDFEKLKAYKSLGINRISFGIQSANADELQFLGRIHNYEEFEENFKLARKANFCNINVDLMSGLPGQSVASMLSTLEKVVKLGAEHISLYSLIIEEGTPLADMLSNGEIDNELTDEEDRSIYHAAKDFLKRNGYLQYEISNFAKEGYECRHNVGYWKCRDYIGFGIGAASLIGNRRFTNDSNIDSYICGNRKCSEDIRLSEFEQMSEMIFLGLRMNQGISENEFEKRFGIKIYEAYQFGEAIRSNQSKGLLERDNGRIYLTERGMDLANYVMSDFV